MVRTDRRSVVRGLGKVGLLPPAALAVHELRYLLAYGGNASATLERQGHSYLHSVTPWIVLVIALVAGGFLRSLGRAFSGHTSMARFGVSFLGLWLACFACLVAIYAGQETLEGIFAAGHPGGWVGVFGYGGWWAIPAAACLGLVLAAAFHGAHWVLSEVAGRHARPRARPRRHLAP
ncbi:MAG: hypothetical protein WAL63_08945, partial [Solirubrobacteraceae bacterium]